VREALDAKVLHDLFDLLLEVQHFGLEFCSLFFAFFASLDVGVVKEREREREEREERRVSVYEEDWCRRFVPGEKRDERRKKKKKKKKNARWRRVSSSRRRFGRQSRRNPRTTWRS